MEVGSTGYWISATKFLIVFSAKTLTEERNKTDSWEFLVGVGGAELKWILATFKS